MSKFLFHSFLRSNGAKNFKMLVTIKTLTNTTFKIELAPTDTVNIFLFLLDLRIKKFQLKNNLVQTLLEELII